MFTKLKLAAVASLALITGVAGIAAANGSGDGQKMSREERKAKMLEKFDLNKDGKLDASERAAMKEARAEKRFEKLDANGDGVISKDEFKAGMAKKGHHRHGKHFKGAQGERGQRGGAGEAGEQ